MESVPNLTVDNEYRPDSAILGITCERCHGAGQTSKIVVSDLEGSMDRLKGRSHWIRVYPDSAPGR